MQRLHYTGDWVLVADDVGEALVTYARALAEARTAAVASIPVVDEEGRATVAEFLLGPASQLYLTAAEDATEVAADRDVVADLQRRTRMLRSAATFSPQDSDSETRFDHDAS